MKFIKSLVILCITIWSCETSVENQNLYKADVIVYGGTSAAIIAAVEVTESGKSVIVVSPDIHLGGLTSGGLGWSDTGKKEAIGGLSRKFYQKIYACYNSEEAWKWEKKEDYGNTGQGTPAIDGEYRTQWIFEPHVAEKVYEDFVSENKLKVFRDEWLNRENGVKKEEGKIVSITTLSGKTFTGKMFIDASYEGDLMAPTGVS